MIISPIRGPVLIDFNISSRVSAPVSTVTATPGYLPHGLIGDVWSPRVDLHQLGLTLLQVASGDQLWETNRADLVEIAASLVSFRTVSFIEKLIAADAEGYSSAFTARRDARRLLDHTSR